MTIEELYQIIEKRKQENPDNSYIAALLKKGQDRVVQKIGEEATEVIIAAKNGKKKEIIAETADLWFHSLIMLASLNILPKEIFEELERRKK